MKEYSEWILEGSYGVLSPRSRIIHLSENDENALCGRVLEKNDYECVGIHHRDELIQPRFFCGQYVIYYQICKACFRRLADNTATNSDR